MKTPKWIMIHHTAVSYDKNPDQFKATNNYHFNKWKFQSSLGYYIGYNYEISKSGRVRQARADGEETAACTQHDMNNGICIHIALDGNFDVEKPANNQIYALRDLLRTLSAKYGIPADQVQFHNQYAPKSCPGKNMDLNFVRSLVRQQSLIDKSYTLPARDFFLSICHKMDENTLANLQHGLTILSDEIESKKINNPIKFLTILIEDIKKINKTL